MCHLGIEVYAIDPCTVAVAALFNHESLVVASDVLKHEDVMKVGVEPFNQ